VGRAGAVRNDGWICAALRPGAPRCCWPDPVDVAGELHAALREALDGDQALFFRALADRCDATASDADIATAVWDLVWAGWLTNDTIAPVRSLSQRHADGPPCARSAAACA